MFVTYVWFVSADIVDFRNNRIRPVNVMDPLEARLNVAVTALPGSAGARVELLLSSIASSPGVFTTNITPVVVAPSRAVIIITGLELVCACITMQLH